MTDHTTRSGATVARATRVHPGRCAQCRGVIIGGRARRYCAALCRYEARVARARTREHTPEWIAHRRVAQRAYRDSAVGRRGVVVSVRKGRLDGTHGYRTREVYLASMKRRNRKRRRRNRAWSHEHQTKYAGTELRPTCATCGAEVPWAGRGRPRKRCPIHHLGRGVRR